MSGFHPTKDEVSGEILDVNIVSGGAANGAILDGVDSNIKATVLDKTNSNPVATAIVDSNGDQITSFGGGTQYTEDAAAAANPVGNALILVREDGRAGSLTNTDGDNVAARGNNKGELYVIDTDLNALVSSVVKTEDAVHSSGDKGVMSLGVVNANFSILAAEGDYAPFQLDQFGRQFVIEDSAAAIKTAAELIDDTVATLGTTTYTEATTKGLTIGAVRRDADTTLVNTTNEIGPLQMDANGRLKVEAFSGETLPVSFTGSTDVATQTTLASLLTSSQLIDDGVYTDDTSTHTTGTSKGYGIMAVATPTDGSVDANDIGMVAMTTGRALKVDASGVAVPVTDNSSSLSVDWNGTQPVTGSGNATGALRVELANNGTGLVGLNAGTNMIGKLAANSGVDIGDVDVTTVGTITPGTGATNLGKAEDVAHAGGDVGVMALAVRLDTPVSGANASGSADYVPMITDSFGKLWTTGSYAEDIAHTAADPLVAIASRRIDTPATSSGTSGDYSTIDSSAEGALWTTNTPTTTGGCSIFKSLDIDETEEDVKTSAGNVYGYYFSNVATSYRYLKFYNATAANVSVGTTVPVATFGLPPTSAGHVGFSFPLGFSTAICVAATTAAADADTGAPATSDVIINVFYK
jgi:hypothetical protein